MPKAAPGWITADGKVHTDYVESLRHDIYLWLAKAGENETIARRISNGLKLETLSPFMDMLEELEAELDQPTSFEVVERSLCLPKQYTMELPFDSTS